MRPCAAIAADWWWRLASSRAPLSRSDADAAAALFRSGVDIVRLDVSVLDKNRRPVRDLTRDDITILVDGAPQR